MLSPVGRAAASLPLPSVIVTVACGGWAGVAASAEGLLGLSTMLSIVRARRGIGDGWAVDCIRDGSGVRGKMDGRKKKVG